MSDDNSHVQHVAPLPPDPPWYKRLWKRIAGAAVVIAGIITWILSTLNTADSVASKVWDRMKPTAAAPQPADPKQPPDQKHAASLPKEQPVKKAEAPRALPCIDIASDIYNIVHKLGGDKFEPNFNKHLRTRATCFVLPLTEAGTKRFQFITAPEGQRWPPTFFAQPLNPADLKRFKPGARLKIEGELVRYFDRDQEEKSDEIYIERARVTEIKEADGALPTGSVR